MTGRFPIALLAVVSLMVFLSPCRALEIVRGTYPGLVKAVDPEYPPELYRRGIGGSGICLLKVNQKTEEGDEVKALKSTGHRILNELAAKHFCSGDSNLAAPGR